jgi:hypothetical protein
MIETNSSAELLSGALVRAVGQPLEVVIVCSSPSKLCPKQALVSGQDGPSGAGCGWLGGRGF